MNLKLFGTIASDLGTKLLTIENFTENSSLKEILNDIKNKFPKPFANYFDEDFTPKRGTLILINGVDFNTLNGLDTKISSSDQISFIPTISGG